MTRIANQESEIVSGRSTRDLELTKKMSCMAPVPRLGWDTQDGEAASPVT
jgi:hypothetical protein